VRIWIAGGGTGGHLYPALAIARALDAADPRTEIFFIGARRGLERRVLPGSGYPHELLDLHPLYRAAPWRNWRIVTGGATAWRQLARRARGGRPDALVATGGYTAAVALAFARVHGIPIVIQDQNSVPGLTVRLFASAARQLHLGFPEAAARLRPGPRSEVTVSGNPIDPPPAPPPEPGAARAAWGLASDGPVLLVSGGSQGSAAINAVVAEWVASDGPRSAGVQLLWATGHDSHARYAHFNGPGRVVTAYVSPMADAYAAADMALSRAGAMTIAELSAWGLPALLVPLPTAAADHQTANALAVERAGGAAVLPQTSLSAATLAAAVAGLAADLPRRTAMREAMLRRARPDAAQHIAARILALGQVK